MKRLAILLLAALCWLALPLRAEDTAASDKSFLENWLETNLSAAGRDVQVTGFAGALSAQATLDELTIADDDGVWLTLRGAVLDWTRSALLTGRLEVNSLTADEIEISRRPVAVSNGPQAESSDFVLPELPVSIDIGKITAKRLVLGAPVLGVATVLSLDGSGWLNGGAGEARLALTRIDGAEGTLNLDASYANKSRALALDLQLTEGPDGIVAKLTGLPGGAPIDLSVSGAGPIDAFSADIALATDGTPRLSGTFALAGAAPDADGPRPLGFRAELAGDPSPLFAPEYRGFFGNDAQLVAEGQRDPDGRLTLSSFTLATDALALEGRLALNPRGWPDSAHLTGKIAAPAGGTVLLPVGGVPTRVNRMTLAFDYDAARGEAWTGALDFAGFARGDLAVASGAIKGAGTLAPDGDTPHIAGHIDLSANGIAPGNAELANAIGDRLAGGLDFSKDDNAPLALSNIALGGADYGVSGGVTLSTDWARLDVIAKGAITLKAADLARFSGVAGRTLGGAAELAIAGNAALPGGPFDADITGTGQDLAIGIASLDRLFAGASRLTITAARDETGTRIDRFEIAAPAATARASATLKTAASQIAAQIDLPDGQILAAGLDGAVAIAATAQQTGGDWHVDLNATGPGGASGQFAGTVAIDAAGTPGQATGNLEATFARLTPYSGLAGRALSGAAMLTASGSFTPDTGAFALEGAADGTDLGAGLGEFDRLITGASHADFSLRRSPDGVLFIDRFNLTTPEVTAQVTGKSEGSQPTLAGTARLRDLGYLVPGLSGAATAEVEAALSDGGWQVSGTGSGPGGTTVTASGLVAADGARATLDLSGRAPLALANSFIAPRQAEGLMRFDLALNGPFALGSLSGLVSTDSARVALPSLRLALDPVTASARLSGGQAVLDANARVSSGGRINLSGPISLSPPYSAQLALGLTAVGLSDPTLYDTVANGTVAVSGPLAGGAAISGTIALGKVELRVPETGFGIDGSLPGLRHIAEPAAVAATRARAGLSGNAATSPGRPFGLDLTLSAPDRVFLRGRGLDAELGGTLRLGGTTANIVTQGGFQLIRGRLDILGNRLVLTQGTATLQGSFDPTIRLVAETTADDVVVRITVSGRASDPVVSFTSSPDLPEDEILARLVFGRGLDQISPFQALKLASAIATLSGQGGAGTIGKLREGFGLDDLDVTTSADGTLAVRAGTYITDNLYTDVTVGADGSTEINLNLTVSPNITARGTLAQDGSTGIGVYFEKDY